MSDDPVSEATDPPPGRYFVAHMQKTAGTALRDRLRATFPDEQIYPNGTDGPDARVAVISVEHLQQRWAARGDQIRLLTGHFPVRTVELLDAPFVTMTVLRHPVDRTLSFLRHQAERRQRGATEDTPLVEIYEDEFRFRHMIQNHMTRTLSLSPDEMRSHDGVLSPVAYTADRLELAKDALAGLDIFGLQDDFEAFCAELAARYGLDVGGPLRSNTTETTTVPDRFVDRIAEDNALDMQLYEYARQLYRERHPTTVSQSTTTGREAVARTSETRSPRTAAKLRGLIPRRRAGRVSRRGGADSPAGMGQEDRRDALAAVDRLLARGRLVDAVDLLAAAYRESGESADAVRLVDLRHQAFDSMSPGPGRTPWPPAHDDPFPDVSGRLPEVDRAELSPELLGGAVAHHGALVVRGLFDDDQVARGRETIQTAQRCRDEASAGSSDDAWFRPFPTGKPQDRMLRRMVAEQGGTWLADSPAATAHFLDELGAAGATDAIAKHLGERPCFSLQKSTMRRSVPEERLTAWHQDGSFLDADVRTMNVWVALTRCGGDHPAPGLEVVPRRIGEILPIEGVLSPHAVSFDLVDEIAAETPVVRPSFESGDALMFDERFLHRTFLDESMTEDRYALECWFFAPSHRATNYLPLVV